MIICPKCSKLHNGRYQDKTGGKKHWCFDCHQKHNAVGTPAYAFAYEWFRSVGLPSGMRQNPLDVIDRMMIAYRIKTGGDWPIPRLRNRTIKIKSWETVPTLNTRSGNSNRRSVVYPRCSYNPAITAQATEDEVFAYLQSIHPYPRTVVPHTANGASCGDIWNTDFSKMPDFDIIFGGFPCQGFSINGTGFRAAAGADSGTINADDNRCYLYKSLVEILQVKQPKYFLFENVGGLTRIEDGNENKMIDVVVKAFEKCGYRVSWKILNASDFGVPQQRKRVYLVGMRDCRGVKSKFKFERVTPVTGKISIADILQTGVDDKYLLKNFWKTYTCKPVKSTKFQLGPEGWGDLYDVWIKAHGGTTIPRFKVIKHLYDAAARTRKHRYSRLYVRWRHCVSTLILQTDALGSVLDCRDSPIVINSPTKTP
jgi:DNA-cytosine methyltransferase